MKEAEEAQWTFLADTSRDHAEIARLHAALVDSQERVSIHADEIARLRVELADIEYYVEESDQFRAELDRLIGEARDAARQDVGGWEVEGFIKRLTRRDDTSSERLVLEAISHLRAFSRDCDALREANAAARQDAQRMRAELENVISLLEEAQSGYIPGCGGDMEWQRSRDVAIKDARAAIEGVAIKESSDAPRP
jgi:hypothetical protein